MKYVVSWYQRGKGKFAHSKFFDNETEAVALIESKGLVLHEKSGYWLPPDESINRSAVILRLADIDFESGQPGGTTIGDSLSGIQSNLRAVNATNRRIDDRLDILSPMIIGAHVFIIFTGIFWLVKAFL